MLARLAPIAILLAAACSDDAGWSRDELPANARVALMVTGTSAPECDASFLASLASVTVHGLDTDAPTVVVVAGDDACAWDGNAIACELTHGPAGTMRIDFGGEAARLAGLGASACAYDYAITAVAAIP
jgi:hypothetical protein